MFFTQTKVKARDMEKILSEWRRHASYRKVSQDSISMMDYVR